MDQKGIISLGEAFVDYISIDHTNTKFQQLLGGASVNVAVGAKRLGLSAYYLCKLGTDEVSEFVKQEFQKEHIDTSFSIHTSSKSVCGVYVYFNENGERYFHSYVNLTPDEVLSEDELKREVFERAKIFYFGSGTLFHEKAKKTTETALSYAKDAGNIIAFDANLRLKRWESEEKCRQTVSAFLKYAHIVKLAEDELHFLTETGSLEVGIDQLSKMKIPYLFITMGSKGAYAIFNENKVFVPAPTVKAIDTTGAGDAFMSALLYSFHEKGLPFNLSQLKEYLNFANKVGAASTTEIGSLSNRIQNVPAVKNFQKL
ncbi:carbohydrate kinase family protein [Neobacillus drentensis]|uniref:carbohydrate kinase family protein n=1 Tax=Neobacillus drentensis TaxID=220684 RepID=UPI00285AD04B|nr:carbohydrate kinase [Neobacillus drentensis]MDR7236911.1 fructokinase [Neobacillus drentensis]